MRDRHRAIQRRGGRSTSHVLRSLPATACSLQAKERTALIMSYGLAGYMAGFLEGEQNFKELRPACASSRDESCIILESPGLILALVLEWVASERLLRDMRWKRYISQTKEHHPVIRIPIF